MGLGFPLQGVLMASPNDVGEGAGLWQKLFLSSLYDFMEADVPGWQKFWWVRDGRKD